MGLRSQYITDQPSSKGLVAHWPLDIFRNAETVIDVIGGGATPATLSPVLKYPGLEFTQTPSKWLNIGAGPTSVMSSGIWLNLDGVAGSETIYRLLADNILTVEAGVLTVTGFAGGTNILYLDGEVAISGVTTIDAKWHHVMITDTSAKNASSIRVSRFSDSILADFRLYDRVLSAEEIGDIYRMTRGRFNV